MMIEHAKGNRSYHVKFLIEKLRFVASLYFFVSLILKKPLVEINQKSLGSKKLKFSLKIDNFPCFYPTELGCQL